MTLRAPTDDDVPAIAELFEAASQARDGRPSHSEEEIRLWLTSPTNEPTRNVRLAFDGSAIVGYADVDPRGTPPKRCWCGIEVRPGVRTDVVERLVAWAEDRAREEQPAVLAPYLPSTSGVVKSVLERREFRLVRHSYHMEIDLSADLPAPVWPDGIAVRTLRKGEERLVWEVQEEAFADSWAYTETPYEEWLHWMRNRRASDPQLWFLAFDRDDLAGISLCRIHEREQDLGLVNILGVRRPWRRRGVGRALLLHSFAAFAARGLKRAGLGVDATSLTGANRLYESVGMRVVRQFDFYEKDL